MARPGGGEMIKMHQMQNKSNLRISENNKIGLVTGVFRAGLVPLSILLRVESEAVLFLMLGTAKLFSCLSVFCLEIQWYLSNILSWIFF